MARPMFKMNPNYMLCGTWV